MVGLVAHLKKREHNREDHRKVHHRLLQRDSKSLDLDAGMQSQTVKHKKHADGDDEAQGEDGHLSMGVNEVGNEIDEHHHQQDRQHNGQDHDQKLIGQTHRSDNGIDGEHDVHNHDGCHRTNQADALAGFSVVLVGLLLLKRQERLKLGCALVNQVQAAQEQHQITQAGFPADNGHLEKRVGHAHQE